VIERPGRLEIVAILAEDDAAQREVIAAIRAGRLGLLSIGARHRTSTVDGPLVLHRSQLEEVSLGNSPADPTTRITLEAVPL
jgi:phage head maturation protease